MLQVTYEQREERKSKYSRFPNAKEQFVVHYNPHHTGNNSMLTVSYTHLVGLLFNNLFLMFCVIDQKRSSSKSPDVAAQGGYATNFGAGMGGGSGGRGVEGQIMANVFKTLVSRLVKFNKDLKTPENMVYFIKFQFSFFYNILNIGHLKYFITFF